MSSSYTACAPSIQYDGISCLNTHQLNEIAKALNKTGAKIQYNRIHNKKQLYDTVRNHVSSCYNNDDTCLFNEKENDFIKYLDKTVLNELKMFTMKPKIPNGKYAWLSDHDINKVLRQYQRKYSDFIFLGAVPRDFYKLNNNYPKKWKISYKDINKIINYGKKKLAIVANLDTAENGGSHWIAIYIDLDSSSIEYFDATGHNPPKDLRIFINKIASIYNLKIKINKNRHQKRNSECGVYSIVYIISRLNGKTFNNIVQNEVSDNVMNKMRGVIFRK